MDANNQFGKFLESLRGKASLRKAALKSGLSHAYIRDLELGRNRSTNDSIKPSPETLRKLAAAYQFPYTDLLKRAGYLEDAVPVRALLDTPLDEVWYVEFGVQSVRFVSPEGKKEEYVDSLIALTNFIEALTERQFVKVDAHLFVNLHKIKKYAPIEGKLYFDLYKDEPYLLVAAIAQRKHHNLFMDYISRHNGIVLESNSDIDHFSSRRPSSLPSAT
ncbi:helix-turn-helix domain-containing protein [Paenibacillus ferrarius]|uniref:helix-turn-helix domain-containing protein n=1 Tax=Paenibacillus ferrarius TaxID=1469647 RepID=UPI003D292B36